MISVDVFDVRLTSEGNNLMKRLVLTFLAALTLSSSPVLGRTQTIDDPKATPAYEVLVLRRVAVESDLIDLASKFTSDSEYVLLKRFELSAITKQIERLQRVDPADAVKLSTTYGHLILRRVSL